MQSVWLVVVAGCGSPAPSAPDAALDAAPPDGLYDDRYTSPADFPRDNCTPGSLAGFHQPGFWPDLGIGLRIADDGTPFLPSAQPEGELAAPYSLTADDLFLRAATDVYPLVAIDICGVDPDGTLRGALGYCFPTPEGTPSCIRPADFAQPPLHRIAGEAEGLHLTRLGELAFPRPGVTTNVRVDGDVAYLSRLSDGLRIVSIADPTMPVEVGHMIAPMSYANDLKLVRTGGRIYVVTASGTSDVIDVTDPAHPVLVAQLPFFAHSVFVVGTVVYLVDGGSNALDIWDLATPAIPNHLGTWHGGTNRGFHDVHVAGGRAYLSNTHGSGLVIADVTDPAHVTELAAEADPGHTYWHSPWFTTVGTQQVAIDGAESRSEVRLLDPQLHTLADWHLRDRTSSHNLMAIGPLVYLAHYRDGIRVLDIADPTNPTQIAYYNTWIEDTGTAAGFEGTFGLDVDPARKRIYVADSIRGLIILQGDATVFP